MSTTTRPPTVIITRAEAAVLLDHLPAFMSNPSVATGERDTLEALYEHLLTFFNGKANY